MTETQDNYTQEWEEVWLLFGQEGQEALDLVEAMLLQAETDPGNTGQIAELFRAMHNFKGMARMMGLSVTESLAHRAEDLIALVRDEGVPLNNQMISLLLEVLDRLRAILEGVLANRLDVEPTAVAELIGRLEVMHADYSAAAVPSDIPAKTDPLLLTADEFLAPAPPEVVPGGAEETALPAAEEMAPTATAEDSPLVTDETPFPAIERIDPAADPTFVQIFLDLARDELGHLHAGLDTLQTDDEAGRQAITAVVDNLKHAAEHMGYARLGATLDDIITTAAQPADETRTLHLNQSELHLFEELAVIEEQAQSQNLINPEAGPDIAWLFRHWYAERVFTNLACLSEVMDDLEQATHRLSAEGLKLTWNETWVNQAAYLLRTIYHGCLFFGLEQVAHLTLALEDLYARIVQGEITPGDLLLSLTRGYVTQLGSAIQAISEGDMPELRPLEALLEQVEKVLYLTGTSWVSRMTRDILDLLDLPSEFKEVITPESLMTAGLALANGARFYTVLANLEQDEAVGLGFYEWMQSGAIELITNTTVYQEQCSLFNFLLATTASHEEVVATLTRLDPQGCYLSLTECKLLAEPPLSEFGNDEPRIPPLPVPQPTPHTLAQEPVAEQSLDNLMGTIGELVATHASLQRATDKLHTADLVETVTGLMKQAGVNGEQAQQQLQEALKPWLDHQQFLAEIETELNISLNRLHDMTQALRVRPAAEVLHPLPLLAQEVANRQGKKVEVEVKGAEIEFDRSIFNLLANAAQQLVSFVVTASLETPVQRQALQKSAAGRISVTLSKQEDHMQLLVSDDGSGLDQEAGLRRARELGWITREHAGEDELVKWVLRDGFSVEGSELPDLARLVNELQARRGQLKLASQPGTGLSFELYLPLDRVVMDSMVVRAGNVHYVVPVSAIRRIVKPEAQAIVHTSASGHQSLFRLEEALIPIQSLTGNYSQEILADQLLLVVEKDHQPIAMTIDELIGQQQVLIRPLEGFLAHIPYASGCAVLGEGDIGLVLSLH